MLKVEGSPKSKKSKSKSNQIKNSIVSLLVLSSLLLLLLSTLLLLLLLLSLLLPSTNDYYYQTTLGNDQSSPVATLHKHWSIKPFTPVQSIPPCQAQILIAPPNWKFGTIPQAKFKAKAIFGKTSLSPLHTQLNSTTWYPGFLNLESFSTLTPSNPSFTLLRRDRIAHQTLGPDAESTSNEPSINF